METNEIFNSVINNFKVNLKGVDMVVGDNGVSYYKIIIPELNKNSGVLAGAVITAVPHIILVDKKFMFNKDIKEDIKQELLHHEEEHLLRGIIKIDINDVNNTDDIVWQYFKEEQIINSKVAPTLYSKMAQAWRQMNKGDAIYKSLLNAGIMGLAYISQEWLTKITDILKKEGYDDMIPVAQP